jgi:hypothetical protein
MIPGVHSVVIGNVSSSPKPLTCFSEYRPKSLFIYYSGDKSSDVLKDLSYYIEEYRGTGTVLKITLSAVGLTTIKCNNTRLREDTKQLISFIANTCI